MNLLGKFHNWRRMLRWNRQYKRGRWKNLQSEKEAVRYQKIIESLKKFAPTNPSILDIGCGEGLLSQRMDPKDYSYFLGVDFSKESIKIADEKKLPNAEFIFANALLFQPKQQFDAIIFNEVFYYIHQNEKQKVLDRMLASLTKDGILIASIYRGKENCWPYFKENKTLKELDFTIVKTNEELRYWKVGVYKKL